MDEKVLKTASGILLATAVAAAILLPQFSNIRQADISIESMSGLERLAHYTEQAEEEGGIDFAQQLRVELPPGMGEDEVVIENDYMSQRIILRIPDVGRDYFMRHPLLGKSYHIDDLYMESGVVEITMDSVYEVVSSVEDGYLYLDFKRPREVYDKVVVIDAGHGGGAPGAVKQGVMEKDINLAIVLQLKELLDKSERDVGVYYTRTGDVNPSFEQRAQLAGKVDADLFISVHNNSTVDGKMSSYHGTEVMYDEKKSEEGHSSKRLAQICLEETTASLGSQDNGLTYGNSIYIIRNSAVPAALVEVGFLTNQEELDKLGSLDYQKKAAEGIYNAILRALDEGF